MTSSLEDLSVPPNIKDYKLEFNKVSLSFPILGVPDYSKEVLFILFRRNLVEGRTIWRWRLGLLVRMWSPDTAPGITSLARLSHSLPNPNWHYSLTLFHLPRLMTQFCYPFISHLYMPRLLRTAFPGVAVTWNRP